MILPVITDKGEAATVGLKEILLCERQGTDVVLQSSKQDYLLCKNLMRLTMALKKHGFELLDRNQLVQMNAIQAFDSVKREVYLGKSEEEDFIIASVSEGRNVKKVLEFLKKKGMSR